MLAPPRPSCGGDVTARRAAAVADALQAGRLRPGPRGRAGAPGVQIWTTVPAVGASDGRTGRWCDRRMRRRWQRRRRRRAVCPRPPPCRRHDGGRVDPRLRGPRVGRLVEGVINPTGAPPRPRRRTRQRHGRVVRPPPWGGRRPPWGWQRVIPLVVAAEAPRGRRRLVRGEGAADRPSRPPPLPGRRGRPLDVPGGVRGWGQHPHPGRGRVPPRVGPHWPAAERRRRCVGVAPPARRPGTCRPPPLPVCCRPFGSAGVCRGRPPPRRGHPRSGGRPRVARRVGGKGPPPRPPVGAGRAARRARGAEPLHEPRDGRRRQPRIPRLHRLVRGEPRRPVAARAAAPRRVGPPARRGAAARAVAAPRIVPDAYCAAGARQWGRRATSCHV